MENQNAQESMHDLRARVHQEMEIELRTRLEKDPIPTEYELRAGVFREELEPQVREAIFDMLRKGYASGSSGFYGVGEVLSQNIDGYFEIDRETQERIKAFDAQVLKGPDVGLPYAGKSWTSITFHSQNMNLEEIKQKWNKIVAELPDKHAPTVALAAPDFINQYAPERIDLEAQALRRALELEEDLGGIAPETIRSIQIFLEKENAIEQAGKVLLRLILKSKNQLMINPKIEERIKSHLESTEKE